MRYLEVFIVQMEIVRILETILLRAVSSMTKEQVMRFLVQVTIQDIRRDVEGFVRVLRLLRGEPYGR